MVDRKKVSSLSRGFVTHTCLRRMQPEIWRDPAVQSYALGLAASFAISHVDAFHTGFSRFFPLFTEINEI